MRVLVCSRWCVCAGVAVLLLACLRLCVCAGVVVLVYLCRCVCVGMFVLVCSCQFVRVSVFVSMPGQDDDGNLGGLGKASDRPACFAGVAEQSLDPWTFGL